MTSSNFSDLLLSILLLALLVVAVIDIRTFTISNKLVVAVALFAPLFWWSSNLALWPDVALHCGVAVMVFSLLSIAFYIGMMGGGDVKLAGALALWFSPLANVWWLVVMSLAGGVLTVISLLYHRVRRRDGKPEIPYGVAITVGVFWLVLPRLISHIL